MPGRGAAEILLQNADLKAASGRAQRREQAHWARTHDEDLSGFNWSKAIDGRIHWACAPGSQNPGQSRIARLVSNRTQSLRPRRRLNAKRAQAAQTAHR